MNKVTFNKSPRIEPGWDDAGAIHREVGYTDPVTGEERAYAHCIRVNFVEPFAKYDIDYDDPAAVEGLALEMYEQRADEYEEAQERYEEAAMDELNLNEIQDELLMDWRDEQELWIRYN